MIAEELITDHIPPLSPIDAIDRALQLMDDFKVSHLSVVDKDQFYGVISESDLLGLVDLTKPISACKDLIENVFVTEAQHIFEVVKVVNDHKLSIVPVLDNEESYQGSISIAQLMHIIADMPVANNPGGIIVIELNQNDYSLHHISGIIEENDTKILGTFITSHPDSTKLQLTIKVNRTEIASIIASLQRHEYQVTFFHDNGSASHDIKDRYDSFMNYLNI